MKRFFQRADSPSLGAVLLLGIVSCITLASFSYHDTPQFGDFYKQLAWFVIGFCVLVLVSTIDYRVFLNYGGFALALYAVGIVLILLPYISPAIRGAHAWIILGSIQFQPVEFMKVALLLLFSKFFSRRHVEIARARNLIISFFYLAIPAVVVAKQPDLGSAMILVGLWIIFVLLSGIRPKHFAVLLVVLIAGAGLMWTGLLKEYQRERIISFMHPAYDPLGASYNINQSKIAIGSGGFTGKGIGNGSQVQYGFLPEAKTDFIFAGFVEEWGFIGAVFVTGIFGFLIWRILIIAHRTTHNFAKLFCYGTAGMFMIQFFLNVGANIGVVPITGVTLPFFSYGGSSILMNMIAIGIVQSIAIRASVYRSASGG